MSDLLIVAKMTAILAAIILSPFVIYIVWDYFFPGKIDQHHLDQIPQDKP